LFWQSRTTCSEHKAYGEQQEFRVFQYGLAFHLFSVRRSLPGR